MRAQLQVEWFSDPVFGIGPALIHLRLIQASYGILFRCPLNGEEAWAQSNLKQFKMKPFPTTRDSLPTTARNNHHIPIFTSFFSLS